MARTGINSLREQLDAGMPKSSSGSSIIYTGNEGPKAPMKMAEWEGSPGMDPRPEVREAWKDFLEYRKQGGDKNWQQYMPIWIRANLASRGNTQNRRMASAPDPMEMLDTMAMNEFGKLWKDLTNEEKDWLQEMGHEEGRAPVEKRGIMQAAYGGTARPTYTQSRKQRMAGGGIAGLRQIGKPGGRVEPGISGYGLLDFITEPLGKIKDKIVDDLIPNELKNPAVIAGLGLGLDKWGIPGTGFDNPNIGQGWIGDLLGGAGEMIGTGVQNVSDWFTGGTAPGNIPLPGGYELPKEIRDLPSETLNKVLEFAGVNKNVGGGILDAFGLGSPQGKYNPVTGKMDYPVNWRGPLTMGATIGLADYLSRDKTPFPMDQTGIDFQTGAQAMASDKQRFKLDPRFANVAEGGRIGYRYGGNGDQPLIIPDDADIHPFDDWEAKGKEDRKLMAGPDWYMKRIEHLNFLFGDELSEDEIAEIAYDSDKYYEKVGHDPFAQGGRIRAQEGGLMDLGGMEKDYREEGGFVPIGGQEKADDVPARLSKNEFVFTADAVRAAGGGDIDRGAEIMENLMENLEAGGKVSEESQGLEGARNMFANAQQLEKRII